jgi:hypothetical protein
MTALIPISYLNEACFLSLNDDEKKYNMVLKIAQDDLSDLLGSEFYDEIVAQFSANSFTSDNETLYEDYIKDFLAWQTYYKYLKFVNVSATPTGIRTFNDDNSSIANDVQMFSLEKNVLAEANKYKYKIVNFLNLAQSKDSSKYPLWSDGCREYMSFAITAIDKKSDAMIKVNRSIITNE